MKRTRIIATIGPASATAQKISEMVEAGLSVARLNFSHGTYPEHAAFIKTIRTVARRTGKTVTILQDLSGPKIRVGALSPQGLMLKEGERVWFSNNPKRAGAIPFQYEGLPKDVRPGSHILMDDGLLEVEVLSKTNTEIESRVVVGGILLSHKGINVPGTRLAIPAITEKDKKDLVFGLAHGVDWVALSFVRDPLDIEQLRKLIAKHKPKHVPQIIAKIEMAEAIDHLEAIVHAADGIMVARGDLGIEMPPERVPLIQKRLIKMCIRSQKPVIIATQMLDSMIRNPRPTRAEVSDVANAVMDLTDGVMLSGVSASGKYPVEAVQTMARIIYTIEKYAPHEDTAACHHHLGLENQMIGELALTASELTHIAGIVVPHSALHIIPAIVQFRPATTIFVQVKDDREAGILNIRYGVVPCKVSGTNNKKIIACVKECAMLKKGARLIFVEAEKRDGMISLQEVRVS